MTFRSLPPSTFQIVSVGFVIFSLLSGVHPLRVDTPNNVSECETVKFIWNSNYSPFIPSLHFTNTSLFHQFKNQTNTTLFWTATIPAGNTLYLQVLDSSNSGPAYSAPFPILSSSNDSCLQPSTATSNAAAPTTSNYTGAGGSPSPSPTGQPSDAGAANPSTRTPANTLSTGAIAGIAVACLAAGLLIALGIWLIRRRRKPSSSPRVPIQRQLDSYNYPKPPSSDDGWSVTTPRDPEEELRSQPGGDKTGPSWDASLFVREKTPSRSPSPPVDRPVTTRQAIHPEIPRPLSSYPPLIPTPSPMPMPMSATRESGMWADPSSGTSLSRSSTNPFRARMLALAEAAAANSGTAQAGPVNGSNWQ